MYKQTIRDVSTYRSALSVKAVGEHFEEVLAKTTKLIEVGDGSVISIRNQAGLTRHTLPIMIPAEDARNTFDKNLFFLDTFGLKDNEADFMYTATLLSAIWEDPTINESYNSVARIAAGLYNQWVAGGYIRQFGLDVNEADNVRIVVTAYFFLQGTIIEEKDWRGDELYRLVRRIAEATGIPDKTVRGKMEAFELIKEDTHIDFNWLMTRLKEVSEILNYRMNPITALTAISSSWYRGMTAQPQLALNYKPFFIAMIYTAFNDRSASRTGIDNMIKTVLEGRRRQQAETFVGAIEGIIKEQTKG